MKLLNRLSVGLGIGSFIYLLTLYYNHQINTVTRRDIIGVFIISIFAGVMTILFDIEKLNYLIALILHFILINIVVCVIAKLNEWITKDFTIFYFFNAFIIYLLSWSIIIIRNRISAKELNEILSNNKNDK
ncbi:DUF3021 domain-containing protein [Clostridium baratii]|uniref:DUF3021 domain-containing protein n=1 Tax=Clostridium baratii TaxID=1561 RepID=UPI00290C84DB|nr:DUF3021 domain-containing protein [Clostridium baratii]MDU4911998.1 DUF3021 domain-containing protein [Clostridium baratii]